MHICSLPAVTCAQNETYEIFDVLLSLQPRSSGSGTGISREDQIINAAKTLPNEQFIVATDQGIFYKLQQQVPDKTFIVAPTAGSGATCRSCASCPWMAMNALDNLAEVLETGASEVFVDHELGEQAMKPLTRMLNFSAQQ